MLLLKFKIQGHSMEPTIKNGQTVLVSSLPYIFKKPKVNDVIALENGNKILIKRILKMNAQEVFIAGDNLEDSLDSRKFGMVSKNKILGKVIYKV